MRSSVPCRSNRKRVIIIRLKGDDYYHRPLIIFTEIMSQYISLWENGPVFAQAEHFKIGTDSILLANFANITGTKKCIDLGCASGIISLLLAVGNEKLSVTGLEILPQAAKLAEENFEANGLSARCGVVCGDIRKCRELFSNESFDAVVSNPPYFPKGSGPLSPDAGKAGARSEELCSLEDICRAAAFLLKTGGSFSIVHKPERLAEAMRCMAQHGIEPKRLRLVCHSAVSAPNLVLIEGRRGGRPGLIIEPLLVIRNADGSESDEIKKIYHR